MLTVINNSCYSSRTWGSFILHSLLPFLHLNQPQLCGHGDASTSGTSPELVSLEVSKLFLRGSSSNCFRLWVRQSVHHNCSILVSLSGSSCKQAIWGQSQLALKTSVADVQILNQLVFSLACVSARSGRAGPSASSSQRDRGETHFQIKGVSRGPEERAADLCRNSPMKVWCRWERSSFHDKGRRDPDCQTLLLLTLPAAASCCLYKKKNKAVSAPVPAAEHTAPGALPNISHLG